MFTPTMQCKRVILDINSQFSYNRDRSALLLNKFSLYNKIILAEKCSNITIKK